MIQLLALLANAQEENKILDDLQEAIQIYKLAPLKTIEAK